MRAFSYSCTWNGWFFVSIIARTYSRGSILRSIFFTSQYTVSILTSQFVKIRIRTICDAISSELKSKGRARTWLVSGKYFSDILPSIWLVNVSKADLCNLISSLLVDSSDRPKLIHYKNKRGFVINVYSWFFAARNKSYVWENASRKSVFIEIQYSWIIDCE